MGGINKLLEENPLLKYVLLGGLGVLMLFLIFTRLLGGGGGEEEGAPVAGTPPVARTAPPAGRPGTEGAAGRGRRGGAESEVSKCKALLKPGAGLPVKVATAYCKGRGIVLLVTQRGGIEDRLVRASARLLRKRRKRVAVFRTTVERISAYSRITRGADVSRVPVLVVVPPGQTEPPLKATVRQGFLDAKSIIQAVDDALYKGPTVPPYPD